MTCFRQYGRPRSRSAFEEGAFALLSVGPYRVFSLRQFVKDYVPQPLQEQWKSISDPHCFLGFRPPVRMRDCDGIPRKGGFGGNSSAASIAKMAVCRGLSWNFRLLEQL